MSRYRIVLIVLTLTYTILISLRTGVRTMTVKKAGWRNLTINGEVLPEEFTEVPLDQLQLSPRNPRIRRLLRTNPTPTPEDIYKFLLEEDGVADLQRQIRENRGVVDPILIDPNYQVVEGNCRLAIYIKLRAARPDEPQWRTMPCRMLTKVTPKQVRILQAIYHVHSNKIKWGAYEQQGHLQEMRNKDGMEPAEIARVLGLSTKVVNTLLDAYEAMTKHYVETTKPGEDKRVWSHFHELFKKPQLATFRSNEKNLKTFAKLVKAKKIKGADVRKLPAIVTNPKALQELEKDGIRAAEAVVAKADPSKVYPLFKQIRKTTKLLNGLRSKAIEDLKTQPAEQMELRALHQALVGVAKAANIKLV
jgi:DNA-binding MarR family transcriptional regulator